VEIPKSLVEKLPGAHFIRVAKCDKRPLDKDWPEHPMKPDDPRLQAHLRAGGNYGVVGGNGLVILDADTEDVKRACEKALPKTFTVQSPGSLGWHLYYFCELERPIRLYDKEHENVGDVQGKGKMVVGPGSWHPNGLHYRILRDLPIAHVTEAQLREALKEWIVPDERIEHAIRTAPVERNFLNITMRDVLTVGLSQLRRSGDEYYGPHPIHGSKTGRNFWVNFVKDCFYCFRHNVGGGPLTWLAIEEGIIRCEDAGPGALRGENWKRVLEALERRGFKVPEQAKRLKGIDEAVIIIGENRFKIPVERQLNLEKCNINPAKISLKKAYLAKMKALKECEPCEGVKQGELVC
jgi:hypothetical protein